MATRPVNLPPGFELEQPSAPQLPPGFVLEQDAPAEPPGAARRFFGELGSQLNPVTAVTGLRDAAAHPIEAFKADANARQAVYQKAEQAFKSGDYAGGAAHLLYSVLPLIGPQLSEAGSKFQSGDIAGGAGMSTGMGLNMAAPAVAKDLAVRLPAASAGQAERLYRSALKPSIATNAAKVDTAVKTGLANEIQVSAKGMEKLGDLVSDLNAKLDAAIPPNSPATVNSFKVASRLSDTAKRFANQVNPEADLAAVGEAGNEFLRNQPYNIPAKEAAALKSGTYKQLGAKAYGEMKTAAVESQKALARGIKEELINIFPDLKDYGIRESQLLKLQPLLERAVRRIDNHQLTGIGTPLVAAGTKAVTQSTKVAATVAAVRMVMEMPEVKSELAFQLYKGSKGQLTLPGARLKVQGYINSLGNATNQESAQPQLAPAY